MPRDSRDVAVSCKYFWEKENYSIVFEEYMTAWVALMERSYHKLKQEQITSYEKLYGNTTGELKRILNYLNIDICEEKLEEAIEKEQFKKRKDNIQEGDFETYHIGIQLKHMRTGKIGEWKEEIPPDLVRKYNNYLESWLERLNYEK